MNIHLFIDNNININYYIGMRCKDEKKYEAIINASINQFKKDGFANASIAKIAKLAGVSPATIYIYFENKEDLIGKIYLRLRKEMSEAVLEGVNLNGCVEAAYKDIWSNYYHYCLNHYEKFDYIMQFTNSPSSNKYNSEYGMCYFNKIYNLFAKGKEEGIIKDISDEILFAYTFYPSSQLARRNLCCGSKLCSVGVNYALEVAWDAVRNIEFSETRNKNNITDNDKERRMSKQYETLIVEYIKAGEKLNANFLGVEFEHFLIDKDTLRSYNYFEKNGQKEISEYLAKNGWKVDYVEEGNILALSKEGNTITFEPGGQVEISVRPIVSVADIERIYCEVKKEINNSLTDSQSLVSLGYHPLSKIDDLSLLPKDRYNYMYDYLHKQGTMARNMMKGTASTQVSIDYESEEDFKIKYRVSNFLSPFIARIFDSAPIFEGTKYDKNNLRIEIWENTDNTRSKMPPGVLDGEFGYEEYAKYIMNTSPIIMPEENTFVFTEGKSLADLGKEKELNMNDLEHAMSMVFPDVRVKNFIEIRMADALPSPYNMAIPALIKGIFYDEKNLNKYFHFSKNFSDADFVSLNDRMKQSYDFNFICKNDEVLKCHDFILELIEDAITSLSEDEKKILVRFKRIIEMEGSFSNYLKRLYDDDSEAFKSQITEREDVCLY